MAPDWTRSPDGYSALVKFDDDVQLDTSQVSDERGRRFGMPGGGMAVGGGAGVIGLLLALFLGINPFEGGTSSYSVTPEVASNLAEVCRTGADANLREDCRIVGVVNSVQAFWGEHLPAHGKQYQPAVTRFFTGRVQTGCGAATSAVGPFYCPADQHAYFDLSFFEQLRTDFGAQGGPFAQAYIVAHEYAHHVQNLLGTTERVRQGATGPTSGTVRLELQADCYAGVWANNAVDTGYIVDLTDADIADGLDAAAAVGDDRIQEKTTGEVDPHKWTHGSSAQRQAWFVNGYESGDMNACDTFAAGEL